MILALPDLASMEALGRRIAAKLRPGDVVALSGPLGAGKTTLAREILAGCGHAGEVPSPSFTILETYPDCTPPLVHADFYRLESPAEAAELGLDEYRENAVLIAEWPERLGGFAGEAGCLAITLVPEAAGRRAIVKAGAAWQGRSP
ncbi:MAG: tRNA (adenosine(37)-N6)-threonylcarbamoyltransferase complex ATPase subunit type 1 TsaE [Altererythrobacter sp.]|nr:tRNA (adenosine(37)-N6)-threonylcarbamoyltransferase complex ATPase subunit type 1 TsaE [Altererythrobacter sp.]